MVTDTLAPSCWRSNMFYIQKFISERWRDTEHSTVNPSARCWPAYRCWQRPNLISSSHPRINNLCWQSPVFVLTHCRDNVVLLRSRWLDNLCVWAQKEEKLRCFPLFGWFIQILRLLRSEPGWTEHRLYLKSWCASHQSLMSRESRSPGETRRSYFLRLLCNESENLRVFFVSFFWQYAVSSCFRAAWRWHGCSWRSRRTHGIRELPITCFADESLSVELMVAASTGNV